MVIMLGNPMPFLCQTHLQTLQLLFEVCKLYHREGNHVDIQIKSQQHPPTYQLKRGLSYWVYSGTSKPVCAMNGVIHCLSDGMWQRRYRLSMTSLLSWITSESGWEESGSFAAPLDVSQDKITFYHPHTPTPYRILCSVWIQSDDGERAAFLS